MTEKFDYLPLGKLWPNPYRIGHRENSAIKQNRLNTAINTGKIIYKY